MIILLHSSKTMKTPHNLDGKVQRPEFEAKAAQLGDYLKTLSSQQIAKHMQVSNSLAGKTKETIETWSTERPKLSRAIDSFVGDIYSGLQASTLDSSDRTFANNTLRILSGLYGILKPLDAICPYRLEMGYRLPDEPYKNLYAFWGNNIAKTLPHAGKVVNLAAVEYAKAVTPFIDASRIITPRFLSVHPKTKEPTFVVVHAKIARGAFAHWLIKARATDSTDMTAFTDLGYAYDDKLSSPNEPVFVCQEFGGLGLSVRLK
ncbi:MAG TPA: YaaA family protein [Candidatus Saccharimonadales bacterium]|nr:YaaA family protein [Candidatus Saccharimonadales bacterium]